MYLTQRHSEIIQMAKDNGRVLVDDLAQHFAVSPQTIRKDLNDLCEQRMLTRIHGGRCFRPASKTWNTRRGARSPRRRRTRSAARLRS